MGVLMRSRLHSRILAAIVALCALASAARADDALLKLNIPPQPLNNALHEFARQSGLQIFMASDEGRGITTPRISGTFTARAALEKLLGNTGLHYEYLDTRTVAIRGAAPIGESSSGAALHFAQAQSKSPGDDKTTSSTERFEVAQTGPGKDSSTARVSTSPNSSAEPVRLEEVVVTAQKRAERLQDVPVPVVAINAQTLVENNQLRLQDFYTGVPGLNVTPQASISYQSLSIRGITTGVASNPSVGIAVDDMPYGSSTAVGGGGGTPVPDIDPGDLARIEVLRGPQGTLYGASSLGGLIKFVTVDPSTEEFSGRVEAGTSSVYNGAELGYNFRASVNVPLSDTWALRASGFTRQDPGYIDNMETGRDGVNKDIVRGGRVSALWKPSESLSLKLGALYQDYRGNGFSDVDKSVNGYAGPTLADLQQYYLRGTGAYDRRAQAYSALLKSETRHVRRHGDQRLQHQPVCRLVRHDLFFRPVNSVWHPRYGIRRLRHSRYCGSREKPDRKIYSGSSLLDAGWPTPGMAVWSILHPRALSLSAGHRCTGCRDGRLRWSGS